MRTITNAQVNAMYKWAKGKTIYDAYKNPSAAKQAIWERIVDKCADDNGYDLCVRGGNCYHFTAMYKVEVHMIGEVLKVIYPTRVEFLIIEG